MDRPWWQSGTKAKFAEQISRMETGELQALTAEIGGAVSVTQGQIEGASWRDEEWRGRARQAVGFLSERRSMVRAELTRRCVEDKTAKAGARAEAIARARRLVSEGDTAQALLLVLDILDGRLKGEILGPTLPRAPRVAPPGPEVLIARKRGENGKEPSV